MYYVAYDHIGKLLGVSSDPIDVAAECFCINVEGDMPDLSVFQWNSGLLKFEPRVSDRILTKLQFMNRFTATERIAVRELAKTNLMIDDFMQLLALAEEVNLDDITTQQAIGYLTQLGIFTPDRMTAILG
jgi:hypothetical protein